MMVPGHENWISPVAAMAVPTAMMTTEPMRGSVGFSSPNMESTVRVNTGDSALSI